MGRFIKRFSAVLLGLIVGGYIGLSRAGIIAAPDPAAQAAMNAQALSAEIIDESVAEVDDLSVTVSATGTILPNRQTPLNFAIIAPVREVLVQEGQSVHEGDVLARLDTFDLEISLRNAEIGMQQQQVAYDEIVAPPRDVDVAVAEAALAAAQAQAGAASGGATAEEINIAEVQLEAARNALWQQQLQRDATVDTPGEFRDSDTNDAGAQNLQAESRVQQAEYDITIAETNLANVQNQPPNYGQLASASASIVQAQIQIDRLQNGPDEIERRIAEVNLELAHLSMEAAEVTLAQAELTAPFDGVIVENNLVIGELPPAGAGFQLMDTTSYYVDLAVDETDIVDIQVGQTVQLSLDALPEANIVGTITRVALTPTQVGQVVTYTARVTLDPTLAAVRSGMTATATIVVSELDNVLMVRNRFIRIDRTTGQAYVTVIGEEGLYEEVEVELGLRNDTFSEVISGLEPGQQVFLLPRESFLPDASQPGGGA
ncbi:MAG: HlyD family efflux transporter periplasmic adaptor subunit [Burkholderiales bacterium]|nr:HlyD family efflux transporter periplasmic adaptor subunit [Anaerolineae bacterium]